MTLRQHLDIHPRGYGHRCFTRPPTPAREGLACVKSVRLGKRKARVDTSEDKKSLLPSMKSIDHDP
jgi:hypothetical protein